MRLIHMLMTASLVIFVSGSAVAKDLLPSWNDGPTKNRILEFVAAVTDKTSKDYVEPGRAHRHLRQRRHSMGRIPHVYAGAFRIRSDQGACTAAS